MKKYMQVMQILFLFIIGSLYLNSGNYQLSTSAISASFVCLYLWIDKYMS